jgi:hypothetical protein
MAEHLWTTATALADSLRETPRVESLLRAFDPDAGDLAKRVSDVMSPYSWLRISPLLLGVRLNRMSVTAQLLRDTNDQDWLADAVEAGTGFQVVVEFLRSRLPGYPVLRVPHRRPGSAYLIETDANFFHNFSWEQRLSRLGLHQTGPPDMTKLGGSDDCAELLYELVAELAQREAWRQFADAQAALSDADRAILTEVGKRFAAEVTKDAVVEHAGSRRKAQYEYRMAVLEEHVASTSGAVLKYLHAFERVDELISIVAAFMQTVIVRHQLASVAPEQMDLGQGGEVVEVNLLLAPDRPFLIPGEVMVVDDPPAPKGLLYPESFQHFWRSANDPNSSRAQVAGKFIFL